MQQEGPGTAAGNFPQLAAKCGKSSFSIFHGFQEDKYTQCLSSSAKISSGCASCFAASGKYGFDNCKGACLTSWCSSKCLDCVDKYHDTLVSCVGSEPPSASPCNEEVAAVEETAAGQCSAADAAAMQQEGPGTAAGNFPQLAAKCGKSSFSIFHGFQEDKYTQCLSSSAKISSGCASCFAASGKYGFDNCKGACLTSWCSSKCLDCVDKYHDTLVSCVGSEPPSASPCQGDATIILNI